VFVLFDSRRSREKTTKLLLVLVLVLVLVLKGETFRLKRYFGHGLRRKLGWGKTCITNFETI